MAVTELTHCVFKTFPVVVKTGIAVPAYNVNFLCKCAVVKAVVHIHKVGCNGNIRVKAFNHLNFAFHTVNHIPCCKTAPLQHKSHNINGTVGKWRFNLLKTAVFVTPEGCPPGLVQLFYIVVKLVAQILAEFFLTQRTEAFATHFVADMPHKQTGMMCKTFRQHSIYVFQLAAEVFAAHTVVVAVAVVVAYAHIVNAQTVGILSVQPRRLCP